MDNLRVEKQITKKTKKLGKNEWSQEEKQLWLKLLKEHGKDY